MYTSAFLSFAHDSTNQVVFEFRAYHGVVEYQQGNSNIQYFVLSEDLYEIGEVVYQAVQEFGGSIKRLYSRSEGDRMNSLCFLDPDGLKMVLARSLFLKWMDGVNK
ncbi:hypothetical protein IFM89_027575 [Coptis chinensis]|uniref:Lactoylglutathione lyase n=1 Tax=Coptis chinensis TaxID=261450 RepID=A0A835HMP0_9MAGN|nr:hypothetical protein IFM89_027575 [Coptis chinensis]